MDGEDEYSDYDATDLDFQDVHSVNLEHYKLPTHNIEHPREII